MKVLNKSLSRDEENEGINMKRKKLMRLKF